MSKWEWKKLKDICEKGSSNIKQSDLKDLTGDYPIFGASGYIQNVDFYQRNRDYIGIIKDGSGVGRTMLLPAFSSVIGTLQYILPKEGNDIKFINYALQNIDFSKSVQGAAIPHIYFKDYGETEILVPPLSEQKRIVKFLDNEFSKIETLKTNAETNLKNAKELFETTLEKELNPLSRHSERSEESDADLPSGWEWKTLDEFSTNLDAKRKPVTKKNRVNGNYPYYGASGIVDYVDSYIYDGKYLLISEDGANLVARSTPIAFIAEGKFWVNNHAHIIETANEATLQYLVYFFENLDLSPYVKGMAQPKLSQDSLYKIQIPLPPLSVQKEIVARLDKLSENVKRLEANYKQIIADCDELKKSILKKTFEGDSRSSRE